MQTMDRLTDNVGAAKDLCENLAVNVGLVEAVDESSSASGEHMQSR